MQKILLIEDDPTLAANIRTELLDQGYFIDIAYDGDLGSKLLLKNGYNCIVMDVNLPHRNGFELCKEFRTYNTHTPVLMLTAFDEVEDKLTGFESGADDYLTKPFYTKELIARLKVLLRRNQTTLHTHNADDNLLRIDDLQIDTDKKKVSRNNIGIELSRREYQILVLLAQAKGNSVSKQDLLKNVWGSTFEASTNTVEVFINFLRNKIDKPFQHKLIKTRIGYGYYLDAEGDSV